MERSVSFLLPFGKPSFLENVISLH
jgi:hypothetical protein